MMRDREERDREKRDKGQALQTDKGDPAKLENLREEVLREENLREEALRLIDRIRPADETARAEAIRRQDSLAKPPGSLGGLETISIRMAGITGRVIPEKESPGKACIIVFCADNGVADQGVSSAPQSVTRAQTINFTRRLTGVGALCLSFGSELLIVDMGVKDPIPEDLYDQVPLRDTHKIIDRRIRPGTWDISLGPAMTEEEALRALLTGAEMAKAAADAGFGILGIGEMGIGNTTTSAAVLSVITGAGAEITCGRGGGVNDTGFRRKKEIVEAIARELKVETSEILTDLKGSGEALPAPEAGAGPDACDDSQKDTHTGARGETHADSRTDSHTSARLNADSQARLARMIRVLSRCGGFDIAAMAGAFLGAAAQRIPVVIDGYISVVAALAAAEIAPAAADDMFVSHRSAEPGYMLAANRLSEMSPGLDPFLSLDMRLGEGSGCPIAFEVIRGACAVMRNMGTFQEAEINDDYLEEVRAGGCY